MKLKLTSASFQIMDGPDCGKAFKIGQTYDEAEVPLPELRRFTAVGVRSSVPVQDNAGRSPSTDLAGFEPAHKVLKMKGKGSGENAGFAPRTDNDTDEDDDIKI